MSPTTPTEQPASRIQLLAAFAAVYVIWGSTYLAIRFAVDTLPPFLMAGLRFLFAGGILFAWTALRGAARPTASEWKVAAISGALLLLGGNGGVSWAEQYISSGIAALLVTTTPLWMVLLDWARPGGVRPGLPVFLGLLLGIAGVVVLVGPGAFSGSGDVNVGAALVVLLGSLSWAVGSVITRSAAKSPSVLQGVGMQMLVGGVLLTVLGLGVGERIDPAGVSTASWLALLYLILVGALVGYTAYVWLLGHTTAAKASTYAYVNPAIAVLLGAWLADEVLNARVGVAALLIVGAVVLITTAKAKASEETPTPEVPPEAELTAPQRPASAAPSRSEARIER